MSDSTPTLERVARALCAKHYAERFKVERDDPYVLKNVDGNWRIFVSDARAALDASGNDERWQPIETAPRDGAHFLAFAIDLIDEYDEDNRLIARAVPTPTTVIAYHVDWLSCIMEYPYRGSILEGRRYTHWQPLPDAPAAIARTQEQSDG